jgi:hypothetical protein
MVDTALKQACMQLQTKVTTANPQRAAQVVQAIASLLPDSKIRDRLGASYPLHSEVTGVCGSESGVDLLQLKGRGNWLEGAGRM